MKRSQIKLFSDKELIQIYRPTHAHCAVRALADCAYQRSKDIMECYCPRNSVIEEWGVIAVHLMKSYSFADGFYVNI